MKEEEREGAREKGGDRGRIVEEYGEGRRIKVGGRGGRERGFPPCHCPPQE